MLLNENQLHSLIQMLVPKFDTAQKRRSMLEQAFGDDPGLLTIGNPDAASPEQFTSTLINELANRQIRTESGELALMRLLTSLQDHSVDDRSTFGRTLQPYINLLHRANAAQTVPAQAASAASIMAGARPAVQTGRVKVRRRKKRGPVSRTFKLIKKIVKWQVVVAALLVILIAPTALVTAMVTDVTARVNESYLNLKRTWVEFSAKPLSDFTDQDFVKLRARIDDLGRNVERARQQTSFLRPLSSALGSVGPRLAVLDAAQEVVKGAQDMLTGIQPVLVFLLKLDPSQSAVTQFSSSDRIAELLRIGQGNFNTAGDHLAAAAAEMNRLNLAQLSPDILLSAQELLRYNGQLQQLDKILQGGPDLLTKAFGLDRPQNYLVLSQNSDELRPSGGYISTWGWLYIQRAHVIDYGYSATTTTSPNPPPDTPDNRLQVPAWWTPDSRQPIYTAWDGSWYADFSTTAKLAADYYDKGDNPRAPVDGVLGIDMIGFEDLLSGLGQVSVPQYDEVVTPGTFRQVVYRIREQGGDEPHKRFLAALYKQILADWQSSSKDHSNAIITAMLKALQEKHIMIYFRDPDLNQAVHLLGWDGAQNPGPDHDYLMVADANVGGSKSNSSIARQLTYDVEIQDDGTLRSRTSIDYNYSAAVAAHDPGVNPKNYADINYFNIIQLFAPKDSNLISSKNLQDKVNLVTQSGYTEFVTQAEVKFDSSEHFEFLYSSPALVESYGPYHIYRLLLQKQPGMLDESVDVQITLPPNATIVTASPQPIANYHLDQPVLEFHTKLTSDQWIEVVYKK